MVQPLSSITLEQGEPLVLKARATGYPVPSARLEFSGRGGGVTVLDSTVEVEGETVFVSFRLEEVSEANAGIYKAVFENKIGSEETSAIVNITKKFAKPKLVGLGHFFSTQVLSLLCNLDLCTKV